MNNYEVENASIGSSVELLLMDNGNKLMKLPDNAKILRYPNMWIGGTAYTCCKTYDVNYKK